MVCYRGGRYTEEDAKVIIVQILGIVAFCHLQGVVHRDLKPEVCIMYYLLHMCFCIICCGSVLDSLSFCYLSESFACTIVDLSLLLTQFIWTLKQNFLFTTRDENAPMKLIDFGLSDLNRPGNCWPYLTYCLCELLWTFYISITVILWSLVSNDCYCSAYHFHH